MVSTDTGKNEIESLKSGGQSAFHDEKFGVGPLDEASKPPDWGQIRFARYRFFYHDLHVRRALWRRVAEMDNMVSHSSSSVQFAFGSSVPENSLHDLPHDY
jgi:hypothetical protein